MAVTVTDGEISAIHFMKIIAAKAPQQVRDNFLSLQAANNWEGYVQSAQPLLAKLTISPFSAAELAEVANLTPPQQDVCVFYNAISKIPKVKSRVDALNGWGAWESVARFAASAPNSTFKFAADDVKRVFDPSGVIKPISDGQAQAKMFFNTINQDAAASDIRDYVNFLVAWGGWQLISDLVTSNKDIPFKFSADDVRTAIDPDGAIKVNPPELVKKYSDIRGFYTGLEAASKTDTNVATFFDAIKTRVEHGCWKSIADLVNGTESIPFKGFEVANLRAVLDPENKRGSDDACSALAPLPPPAWTKPLIWGIGAYHSVADWSTGAVGSVEEWTKGAAGSVEDWTVGAGGAVSDWTTGAYQEAAGWTSGAFDSASSWTTGAMGSIGDWTAGAAGSVEEAAKSAGTWIAGAGGAVANRDTWNPSKW